MFPRGYARRAIGPLVAALALASCAIRGEQHLIPAGHRGPVVIIFEDEGRAAKPAPRVFEIPRGGVLRLDSRPPEPGLYRVSYFFVAADGSRTRIADEGSSDELQVFARAHGVNSVSPDLEQEARWDAYIVGVPSTGKDWALRRQSAIEAALGLDRKAPPGGGH